MAFFLRNIMEKDGFFKPLVFQIKFKKGQIC